jgi:DNA-binding PadR family transcriptional regulator
VTEQNVRLTEPTLKVLRFLFLEPARPHSGAEISIAAKVGSGTLYPMLARLEAAGWLVSEWESVEPSEVGRPRRRFYKLTGVGQNKASAALNQLQFVPGDPVWT